MMICTECGKQFNDLEKCPFCGAKVPGNDAIELTELELLDVDSEDMLEFEELELEQAAPLEGKTKEASAKGALEENGEDVLELELIEEDREEFEDFIENENYGKIEIKVEEKKYKENEPIWDIDEIKDNLKRDRRRIKIMIALLLACIGSFFNFWGIATETIGNIRMGSLFVGYGVGGALGKLCVIFFLIAVALTVVNLTQYALYTVLVSVALLVAQGVAVVLYSRAPDFVYASVESSVYFDLGFYITAVFCILAVIFLAHSPEKKALKERKARENEIDPEELLERELAIRDEDIQRQKEKLTKKEEKRLAKEQEQLAKKQAKLGKKQEKKDKKQDKKR